MLVGVLLVALWQRRCRTNDCPRNGSEEPTAEEPVAEEPTAEPVAEEPTAEEPVVAEPAGDVIESQLMGWASSDAENSRLQEMIDEFQCGQQRCAGQLAAGARLRYQAANQPGWWGAA
ncbi:MAG: hypothetical protein M5U34_44320 [Chloroflexi bacterium]|nr:hypothetical protein [Chloroflexota bacterium]